MHQFCRHAASSTRREAEQDDSTGFREVCIDQFSKLRVLGAQHTPFAHGPVKNKIVGHAWQFLGYCGYVVARSPERIHNRQRTTLVGQEVQQRLFSADCVHFFVRDNVSRVPHGGANVLGGQMRIVLQ